MHYEGLDPHGRYRIRVVYAGENQRVNVRLDAEGNEIHPLIKKPNPVQPLEFDIPASGSPPMECSTSSALQEPGRGGNGRGCQVAEVMLIKSP